MPSFPPRSEVDKKKRQLKKKEVSLISAMNTNRFAKDKLDILVQSYKDAKLSLLKSQLHAYRENEYRGKPTKYNLEKLQAQVVDWTNKNGETILALFKEANKKVKL